jgi:hypothetical protein
METLHLSELCEPAPKSLKSMSGSKRCRPEELCDPIRRQVEVIIYRKTKTGGI